MHEKINELTLPIPSGLIYLASAGRKSHRAIRPLIRGPMSAMNTSNTDLPHAHRLPASLLSAYVDVFGRGLEELELLA